MSKTLLIYERAVPVSKERHAKWGVATGDNYNFAADINSMPLLAQEFRTAVQDYPIVFAGNESVVMPVVLLGLREAENLFVDDAGKWGAHYIPAFARRYPYVFSSNDGGKTLTLCIDEEFSGISQKGDGERLFDDNGEQTAYLKSVVDFQTEFQAFFQRTKLFSQRLLELELLEPMQAQLKINEAEPITVGGFMAVNREKLKQLPGETLQQLSATDELELIYLHLLSMQNVTQLASQIGLKISHQQVPGEQAEAAAATADKKETKAAKPKKKSATKKKTATRKKSNGQG